MSLSRLQQIDALVKELSVQEDPERLIRVFSQHAEHLWRRDGLVTLTRRGVPAPWYRITRSWRWPRENHFLNGLDHLPAYEHGILGELLYAGKPCIINHLEVSPNDPAAEHLEGMRSLACAPGYDHGKPLNLVVTLRREPEAFQAEDLETLLLNANLLSRAVANLMVTHDLQEANRALDYEKDQVGRMQRHLLPSQLPRIDGLELGASYVACSRAGGDYYDVLALPDEQWGLFVADVSGHGTPAAVVMAMLHTLLHSFPGPQMPPVHVFAHLNRHLVALAPEGMFATALYGIYDPYYRRFRYASAGHPAPRLRTNTGAIHTLEAPAGLPLGVTREDTWNEREVLLTPGDTMLLYTDGIIEGANTAGEPFGVARMDDAFRLGPKRAGALVQHIERHYRDFCNGAVDMDDRTLLAAVAVP